MLSLEHIFRFDNRLQRNMGDKIAAVRVIHDHFYNVCSKHYAPKLYVTVDEQMVSFRGGCPVKVLIHQGKTIALA